MSADRQVRVWDLFVRLFHWSLVLCFFGAYFSTENIGWPHKAFGYATVALVAARVIWGFVGTRYARFSNFVPGPHRLLRYARALLHRREPRHLGHNPAGSVMILFLLCLVTAIGITGWMLTLDAFWGNGTVEELHVLFVDATLIAIAIHVSANLYASVRHRENLVASMVTGNKRAFDPGEFADSEPAQHHGVGQVPRRRVEPPQ